MAEAWVPPFWGLLHVAQQTSTCSDVSCGSSCHTK